MTQHAASRGSDPLLRRTTQRADHPPAASAEEARPSPHVSLLAATALGFAYTSATPLETHIRALGELAGPAEPACDALEQARTIVLEVEVAAPQALADAAELLALAAGRMGDVLDLSSETPARGTALGHCSASVRVA